MSEHVQKQVLCFTLLIDDAVEHVTKTNPVC